MQSKRVAVIDVGSNSIKLLVAESDSPITILYTAERETRIGLGMGQTARVRLSESSMDAAVAVIRELITTARRLNPDTLRLFATSAVRDAINGHSFRIRVRNATGYDLHILSGHAEAFSIAYSAKCDLNLQKQSHFTLLDLGGGSLECVHYAQDHVRQAVSLPLGSVRLTEKYIVDPSAPITSEEACIVADRIKGVLRQSKLSFAPGPLVGMGGSFTLARSLLAKLDGRPVENTIPEISLSALRQLFHSVAGLNVYDRQKRFGLSSGRSDIFPIALITFLTLAEIAGKDHILHSFCNLRCGLAAQLLSP